MKTWILSLSIAALLLATAPAAEKPEKPSAGDRAAAKQGRGRPGGPQRDPARMVARIISQFDKDGDEKLDKGELTAFLRMMQQRRGQFDGRGGKPGKAGDAKRRRTEDSPATPGGEVPTRPASE